MYYLVVLAIVLHDFQLLKILTDATLSGDLKIVRPPKDYFPKAGNLQLMCDVEGDPVPIVVWYHQKTKTPVETDPSIDLKIYADQGLLMINNPLEKETYEFYCNASNNKKWVVSKPVKTGLSYLSHDFPIQPPKIIVKKESESLILPCQLPSGNPSARTQWIKNTYPLLSEKFTSLRDLQRLSLASSYMENNDQNNCSLIISDLKSSDSGRYHCIADNGHEKRESQHSWLLVVSSFNEKILDTSIKQLSQKIGDDIELMCPSGYKDNIRWISSKPHFINQQYTNEKRFIKRNLKQEDRGIYACETNETDSKLLQIYNLSIATSDPMDDKLKIQRKVVIEGVNVMLECDLENSKAEFYWETPQSHPIFPNDYSQSRFRVNKDGFLNIISTQTTDSGKYTCNVHSALDVKHKSIWLEVSKQQLDIYPIISLPAQNLTVIKGSNINLRCEVIGEDIIKIIWYIGMNIKERLVKDWQISFPSKESLLITNAHEKKNTNFYTCEAINEQGLKSSWVAFVNVVESLPDIQINSNAELPVPPVVEPPKNVKSNSLELVWSSDNNPKFKVLYWVEYVYFGSKNGWEIYKTNWPHNFIIVDKLKPDTWYQFLVRSKNQVGIGRASVPTEYVKTKNFMSDEPFSGNVGFQFNKIKLIEPEIVNRHQMKLKWFLNKRENINSFKPSFHTQFYLNFRQVSIPKCIMDKSNGNPFDSQLFLPNNDYCSLQSMDSEKMRNLKYRFIPQNNNQIQAPIDFSKINISKSTLSSLHHYAQASWLADNLSPFHCYNVSISSKNEYRTIYSNNKLILTPEIKPGKPPENVHVYWMLPDVTINIKWDLPDIRHWNGILTGSNIYMKSNESEIVHKFNDSLPNKVISQANPHLDWLFQISILNCVGESDRSPPILLLKLSEALLSKSDQQIISQSQNMSFFKKSWMIATLVVTSVLIWLMLTFITLYLCCNKSFTFNGHKFFIGKKRPDETVSSGKNFKDELFINPMHHPDKENDLHFSDNEKICNINSLSLSPTSSSSFCNPYASTQIFEPMPDNVGPNYARSNWMDSDNVNLYYLSTPIFDSPIMNDICPTQLNYFLTNNQEWMIHPNMMNNTTSNSIPFSVYPSQDDCTTSSSDLHIDSKPSPRKELSVELSVLKNNGTINNLLMSSAPFSDHFSISSKSKSTNHSSNSDSSHQNYSNDHLQRIKQSNNPTKSNNRRNELGETFDQSSEMTHLLANIPDSKSPFQMRESNSVYDTPYSDSTNKKD